MRIIIDGDATPKEVRNICEIESKKHKLEMIVICSYDHDIYGDFKVIRVSKGNDSADFKIIEIFKHNDILITQDYGLASLVLKKSRAVINPLGFLYTKNNIDELLHKRFIGQKIRKSGGRTKGPSKRKEEDNIKFKKILQKVLSNSL